MKVGTSLSRVTTRLALLVAFAFSGFAGSASAVVTSYTIDIGKPIGQRISALTLVKSGAGLEAGKEYVVTGWASVNQATEGPPIWDVVAKHIETKKTVSSSERSAIKILGH